MAEERVQRKLAAILSADVVGYSRLMGEDEEETHRTLTIYRGIIDRLIARHDGRIFTTAGDSLMADFGSAVEAVRCAVSIQEEVKVRNAELADDRKMMFRIGIHVGDVIVKGDNLFGDGVNVAARLEGLAEPGGICLSDDAYRQVKGKTALHFQDLGEKELKNIPDKVRVYSVNLDPGRLSPEAFETLTEERLELPDKPSIAILPFQNMSGDAEQEFFADGMSEDIITVLSRISNLVVMARDSTFVYKGHAVNVGQVGRDLGVRFVLEGSVRKAGDRIRITAQLVDAQSGYHVWADRYDRKLDDIFAVQDEITREIVVALSVNLAHGEEARVWLGRTPNFEVWECLSRGLAALTKVSNEGSREAQRLARNAIALDPENDMAKILLGWALVTGARHGVVPDDEVALAEAAALAGEVFAKNDEFAEAHALMGRIHLARMNYDKAITAGERAIALAPSVATNHAALALTHYYVGNHKQCLVRIKKAIRLSPYFLDWFLVPLGEGYRGTGALEKACTVFKYFVARSPESLSAHTRLTCIHSELGESAKARHAADTVLSIDPDFSVARFVNLAPLKEAADRDSLAAGLLKAGLPE